MRWASALSRHVETGQAVVEVLESVHESLEGAQPDLLLVFPSRHHAPRSAVVARALQDAFPRARLLGCRAEHVIGNSREIEGPPALAVAAAHLPDVEMKPFRIAEDALEALVASPEKLRNALVADGREPACLLLLADPFSGGTEALLRALDTVVPGALKLGGVASGAERPGEAGLALQGDTFGDGWVGITLAGRIEADAIVTQGCRPVGSPMFVTRCHGNLLHEVDGRPPMEILQELFEAADARERALLQSALFIGVGMRPLETRYERGDFLVRNLIGEDPDSGAIAVAAAIETNQVVQFHVRDAHTASDDLLVQLKRSGLLRERARGALLFSCLGRGRGLYGVENHDCDALRAHLGPLPVTGFFGNGEIGPVGDRTFLHAYTRRLRDLQRARSGLGRFWPFSARAASGRSGRVEQAQRELRQRAQARSQGRPGPWRKAVRVRGG